MIYLNAFVSSLILVPSMLYIYSKLLNKKLSFRDKKTYIIIAFLITFSTFNYILTNKFIRIIILTIIFMLSIKYLFNERPKKCIITPIFYQILVMIIETLCALMFNILDSDNFVYFIQSFTGVLITSLLVAIFSIILINIKPINKFYNFIINIVDKIKNIQLLLFCAFVVVALNVFPVTIYYDIKFKYLLLFYSIMIICCFTIIIYLFKTRDNYLKINDKYNLVIKSLEDYEEIMKEYKIANHENKNLLLTIRAMILNKDKNIDKYIDAIIEEKYKDDESLFNKINLIPNGGLKAIIYSSVMKFRKNNIKHFLNIDKKINIAELIKLDEKEVVDICKIIGVLIDNAIEEVLNLNKKIINIYIYIKNNKLYIKISNNYSSKIDIEKIFKEGYSTKKLGRGYGLALVRKIVDSKETLEIHTELTKELFSQTLSINVK